MACLTFSIGSAAPSPPRAFNHIIVKLFAAVPVIKEIPISVTSDGQDGAAVEPTYGNGSSDDASSNRRDIIDLERDFNGLMSRYRQPIYNLAMQLIGDEEEASDITQETFVSAYRSRAGFRGDSKVFTWLYRIAINHSKNRRKSKARARTHEGPSLDAGFESNDGSGESQSLLESSLVADWSQSPERLLEQGELRARIQEAIDSLPQEYRSVLILREMEEMNYNDIAEATNLSLEAVKTRISRARGMVRRRIAPYYLPT